MTTSAHKHPSGYKKTDGLDYPGQIPASKVKRHAFLGVLAKPDPNVAIQLPAQNPVPQFKNPVSQYERRLPSAPKSPPRSMERKNHPADVIPYQGLMLPSGKVEHLMLPAPKPVLLLTDGQPVHSTGKLTPSEVTPPTPAEDLALMAIATESNGYPVLKFLGQFGHQIMTQLLLSKQVEAKQDKLFVVQAESTPLATPKLTQKDILAQAAEHKRLMQNLNAAFKLAGIICNNGNEIWGWLARYGVHNGTRVSDELLAQIQKDVTTEQLKFASPLMITTLDTYGQVIYGSIWTQTASAGAKKYSQGRTAHFKRLYQEEAEKWLEELKRRPLTPTQVLEIGKRLDGVKQGALNFGSRRAAVQ